MGEKQIYEEVLPDGSVRNVHVDHEEERVYLETGNVHPVTGEPLLRFSSCNTAPYPKKPAPTVEEPIEQPFPYGLGLEPEPNFLAPLDGPVVLENAGDYKIVPEDSGYNEVPAEDEPEAEEEE